MKSIAQLQEEIAAYDDVRVGAAQVLGTDWEYEIKDTTDGPKVLILLYVGPEVR
jgi:hypothetical protein